MSKTILAPLLGLESDTQTLQTAYQLAQATDGHIDCLHVRPDASVSCIPMSGYVMGLTVLTPEIAKCFEDNARQTAELARRNFNNFMAGTGCKSVEHPATTHQVSGNYREVEGELVPLVIQHARVHDLVILNRNFGYSGVGQRALEEILVGCGRPVVLETDRPVRTSDKHIAIGWKSTAEAAHAITAVLPFLIRAEKVSILSAEESGQDYERTNASAHDLAVELRWHGLAPEIHCLPQSTDAARSVVDAAHELGADLLVMGAFGHSRTRELIFGGFTRHVLRSAPMPIFLVH